MVTSAKQIRAWQGPALLSYGFRPFFLGAAVWAALAMALWLAILAGHVAIPTRFDPISWHAHELLFGYFAAVAAGFLLTAVPNWTGRLPIVGWSLGALFALWLLGRVAVAVSASLPPIAVAVADLLFLLALAAALGREIVVGRNWRNLPVLALVGLLIAANAIFHWEAANGVFAARGVGVRLGLGVAVMLIALIGGRIVPSFTRNWLASRPAGRLPSAPMDRFDKVCLAALAVAILSWVGWPDQGITGVGLITAGALHLARLARWAGERTLREPLVFVLHAGYAFVPVGALGLGLSVLLDAPSAAAAQHLWMAGGIGLMSLAVMTRASLGHTGRPLVAGPVTIFTYLAVAASALLRAFGGSDATAQTLAGVLWIAAFVTFAAGYGPLLTKPLWIGVE